MPNDTLRANAQAMPIDRRAALGSLAAAGAMLAVPHAAKAASPDAELFALARRAKALGLESDRAEAGLADLEDAFEPPPPPKCLLIREGDETFAGERDGAFADRIGDRFSEYQMKFIRSMRHVFQTLLASSETDSVVSARAGEGLARVTEMDLAAGQYLAEIATAKDAAGIPAAEAKAEALNAEVLRAYRALAFTPAHTVEGVLAKLDAVARCFERTDPAQHPETCSADVVVEMAIVEFSEMRKAAEA